MLLKVKVEKPTLRTLCGLTHEETQLDFKRRGLGPGDAMLLAPEISVMASLTSLDIAGNNLTNHGRDMTGIVAISEALKVTASLTSVSLLANQFDDETVAMLLKLKEEKPTLTTLCGLKPDQTEVDLSVKKLGPQDAKLLAPEISVMPSLTKIS